MTGFSKVIMMMFCVGLTSCGGGSSPQPPPPPPPAPPQAKPSLASRFVIDGVADFSVFSQTNTQTVKLFDSANSADPGRDINVEWGFLNDDRDIYLAVRWDDPTHNNTLNSTPMNFDVLKLILDSNKNGMVDTNDDEHLIVASGSSSHYLDDYFDNGTDVEDSIGDGQGRLKYDAAAMQYTAEFLISQSADANNQDGIIDSTTPFNLIFTDNLQLPVAVGNFGSLFPSTTDTSAWPAFSFTNGDTFEHASIPSGLTGLIAFISDHEAGSNGDIYTFNPATGVTNRVTNLPNLFKDNISLSHDRTRIAFHGAPDQNSFDQYEIYTVNVDGSGLTQLTTNVILDGHPAWSLDDSKIAYVSFREQNAESIVIMDSSGVEINEIAVAGASDNDPDYTADGRIVFKTNRFSTAPNLRIAVMNEDGSNVIQVTDITGKSDHDPIANDSNTLFERFSKDTEFSTDSDFINVGWDIIQAKLDGSGETTLLADGWVNWLPLYDPTSQYIAHQKTVSSYTEVRLMDATGKNLGRLIPDLTKIRYIDWK
ncbi:MAG TPA: hypothetical protein ENJ60_16085 [Aeromonadales bacterium]|nr:hypothetical protein [Aeromonadales bacterium]